MMSHDHISLGVLQICYLENDRTAVLVVVTERLSAMEPAIACTLGQKLWRENLCQTAARTSARARVAVWGGRTYTCTVYNSIAIFHEPSLSLMKMTARIFADI